MPKKIDAALRERAVRLIREHRREYPSVTAAVAAVARQEGVGYESLRRWVAQADVDAGDQTGRLRSTTHPGLLDGQRWLQQPPGTPVAGRDALITYISSLVDGVGDGRTLQLGDDESLRPDRAYGSHRCSDTA